MTDKKHRRLAIVREPQDLPRGPGVSARAGTEGSCAGPGAIDGKPAGSSLQVGELANLTGKTVRALHLYESMGLLRPVNRSSGRYRLFNTESVERVRWIAKLQAVGFSLPELQQILRDQEEAATAQAAATRLKDVFVEKLQDVQKKLAELHRLEHELVSSLTYLDACESACDGSTSQDNCPSCGRHLDQPEQPALVAGVHAH